MYTLLFSSPIVEVKNIPATDRAQILGLQWDERFFLERKYGCHPYQTFWTDAGVKNAWGVTNGANVNLEGLNQRLDDSTVDLIKSEHAKAVDEIKERSKINDDCFTTSSF